MKRNISILIKTTALVLAFMLLLGVGIMSLSFSHTGVKTNNSNFLTPDLAITAPTSQELLQRKFNAYNTVTEENGKSVVTIFSEEQIADFNDRRNNGEWFWLSSEEMLFIINNTVELFKTYDIVYIRDLDGNLNKYYGLSFFSSEEYYASFNGFDLGVTDASFDLKRDAFEGIYTRCKVLNNAVYKAPAMDAFFIFTNISQPLSNTEITSLSAKINPWYAQSNDVIFDAYQFVDEQIFYDANIKNNRYMFLSENHITVYPNNVIPNNIGYYKYDQTSEKVVVIELYEEKTQSIIARIRFDNLNNSNEISELQNRFDSLVNNMSGANIEKSTNYRAVIYLNGFNFNSESSCAIRYNPDGDIELYSFTNGNDIFQHNILFLNGGGSLLDYANQLLSTYLSE